MGIWPNSSGGASAPLTLTGSTDARQLLVKGNGTGQSVPIFEVQRSDSTSLLTVDNGGITTVLKSGALAVALGPVGPAAQSGITFQNGEAGANLYRSAANALTTDAVSLNCAGYVVAYNGTPATRTAIGDIGGLSTVQFANGANAMQSISANKMKITGGLGFWGKTPAYAAQPAAAVTLADVIAILSGYGLTA